MKNTGATIRSDRRPYKSARRPAKKAPTGTTQQHTCYIEAGTGTVAVKSPLQAIDRAINNTTIEAKQKTTEGGNNTQQQNQGKILVFVLLLVFHRFSTFVSGLSQS